MLLDQLLYLKVNLEENILIHNQITEKQSQYSLYKILFEIISQEMGIELHPSKIALGFRYNEDLKNKDEKETLELFIFYYDRKIFDSLTNEIDLKIQIKKKELIQVTLQKEGLIRNTWVPFNTKKNTLENGKINNLLDYNKNRKLSENSIQVIIKPFIKISSNLDLVQLENLYKPKEIKNLREKGIIFEEFEVIYLQKWSG